MRRADAIVELSVALQVATGGPVILNPVAALSQGNQCQQRPQTVPVFEFKLATRLSTEEAAKHRLEDFFRVFLLSDLCIQTRARQTDQTFDKTAKHVVGGLRLARLKLNHQLVK